MTVRQAVRSLAGNPALAYQEPRVVDPWKLLIRSPQDAARVVAENPVFVHCGWCGFAQPEADEIKTPHRCEIAKRIAAEKRAHAAVGRRTTPHFGPRHGDPSPCLDCQGTTYAGIVHDCQGPAPSDDSVSSLQALTDANRRLGLLEDLKKLGIADLATAVEETTP